MEFAFEIDLSRRPALTVRLVLPVYNWNANFARLIPLPADLQHGTPDVEAAIRGGDISSEWELFDHPAIWQESELQTAIRRLAMPPDANQGDPA